LLDIKNGIIFRVDRVSLKFLMMFFYQKIKSLKKIYTVFKPNLFIFMNFLIILAV
jgi:hypothetical protein